MSEILFRRGGGWHDMLRVYKISVDGEERGEIMRNCELRIAVAPGKHVVEARIDWGSSRRLEIMLEEDGTEIIACGPNAKFFLELLYISIWRHDYIWLRQQRGGQSAFSKRRAVPPSS